MTYRKENMITIKELYDWAVAKGVENLPFGISLENLESDCDYYCEELTTDTHDFEIGGYYTPVKKQDGTEKMEKVLDFVWITNK